MWERCVAELSAPVQMSNQHRRQMGFQGKIRSSLAESEGFGAPENSVTIIICSPNALKKRFHL